MSEKNRDKHGRWRDVTIAFRLTQQENELLNRLVKMSGLTKQEFITNNMLKRNIVVMCTPRVHKALKDEMIAIYEELRRIEKAGDLTEEFIEVLKTACEIYAGLKED